MNKILIILSLVLLAACGPSQKDKNIAAVTCSIMGETRNMDAAVRVREMNDAREKIGGEPFLGGDSAIQEAFELELCQELVLGTYDETLQSLKEIEKLAWEAGAEDRKIAAEKQRIAAEKRAEEQRIAAEKRAEEQRIAAEKQRIADSKPTVKEKFYSKGKLRNRTMYQSKNDGGKPYGLSETFYKNGQLQIKGNFKDGQIDGLYEMYLENGELIFKTCYKNGEIIDISYCEK
jgi:type IV secretory pathway VirB10-like protein